MYSMFSAVEAWMIKDFVRFVFIRSAYFAQNDIEIIFYAFFHRYFINRASSMGL